MIRSAQAILLAAVLLPSAPASVVPSFPDLMIRTRTTLGLGQPQVTTWYFKGPRQRTEHRPEHVPHWFVTPFGATIMQCDQNAIYRLNDRNKTYRVYYSLHDPSEKPKHPVQRPDQPADGPEVIVTFDSEDTGERRPLGSLSTRHVKTTITVEPSKGAETPASKTEIDGWYLDLPGFGCRAEQPEGLAPAGMLALRPFGSHDRRIIKRVGTAPRGFAVEETSKVKESGNVVVGKIELMEFSEQPLDESLFEVPPDYSPAAETRSTVQPNLRPDRLGAP